MGTTVGMATVPTVEPLAIDPRRPNAYLQLADQLREWIARGDIPDQDPLPSITRMQQETGLAVATIRRAVAVLVAEGVAYTVPGRGTYAGRPPGASGVTA
jgi:GntR family transcriptional regulator